MTRRQQLRRPGPQDVPGPTTADAGLTQRPGAARGQTVTAAAAAAGQRQPQLQIQLTGESAAAALWRGEMSG